MEDFETGVVRRVGRLLCVGADDVRDRVTESWRGKFRTGKRWRGKFGENGIGCGWHTSNEVAPNDE